MTEKTALPSAIGPRGSGPKHIGVIMDGNGRWAQQRGQPRTQGHIEGLKAAKRVVTSAAEFAVSYLTLYTFSTENWKRTVEEVGFIMDLLKKYLVAEFDFYRENKIRLRHTGNREGLPADVLLELDKACEITRSYDGIQVILALNYGGRDEIVRACKRLLAAGKDVSVEQLSLYMDNPDIPDPDLIIRTAGEFRTSNFLLWEGAYSEYFISDKLWPDWTGDDLAQAIEAYGKRERRYGAVT